MTYECTLQARAWIRYIVWLQYPALYIPYLLGASSQNWFLPLMHSYFILFTWNTPLIAVCGQYLYICIMAGRFKQWPPMIPASWHSWPCIILSCWVCARRSALLQITEYSKSNWIPFLDLIMKDYNFVQLADALYCLLNLYTLIKWGVMLKRTVGWGTEGWLRLNSKEELKSSISNSALE